MSLQFCRARVLETNQVEDCGVCIEVSWVWTRLTHPGLYNEEVKMGGVRPRLAQSRSLRWRIIPSLPDSALQKTMGDPAC